MPAVVSVCLKTFDAENDLLLACDGLVEISIVLHVVVSVVVVSSLAERPALRIGGEILLERGLEVCDRGGKIICAVQSFPFQKLSLKQRITQVILKYFKILELEDSSASHHVRPGLQVFKVAFLDAGHQAVVLQVLSHLHVIRIRHKEGVRRSHGLVQLVDLRKQTRSSFKLKPICVKAELR